jgi:thiol:disulfide interchange protein DsbD
MEILQVKSLFRQCIALLCLGILFSAHAGESVNNKSTLSLFTDDSETFLSPDQAFQLTLAAVDRQHIRATFTVAPGYYLYRDRIKFTVSDRPNAAKLVSIDLPTGEIKEDPNFGRQEVYHHDFDANIVVNSNQPTLAIEARYQGCSDQGLCYAPIKKILKVDFNNPVADTGSSNANSGNNDQELTTGLLKSGNRWLVIAGFFGAGLLLSLTPCVLPMIPILSSIIVGQQAQHQNNQQTLRKWQAFFLSVAYVLGMALSYTLAGIAAGLSGNLLSQSLQNPWVLGSFALVFVALACSMFGLYELRLPAAFESRMVNVSNRLKGGKLVGVFVMGALSALIVSPCVAAPLAGALIYIGQSQDWVLGGIALFALSIGMGVPLLAIGASAGSILPKTGGWMNVVRNFFGILMLAMAIWLISPVIPGVAAMALWAALSIVTAIFLHALDALPARASNIAKLGKGVAIILLVFGIALLVGALAGAKSVWQPLSFNSNLSTAPEKTLPFVRVTSVDDLTQKIAAAKGKPVMLDFYADWCVACKEMDVFTFSDPAIQQQLKNTVLLQADVTANSAEDTALLKRFGLFGPPGIIFFNHIGEEISQARTIGFQDVERFSATLKLRDQHF